MSVNKITTDYTGRLKDINIFPSVNPTLMSAQKVLPGFGKVSSYCAGIQKLIQRYTISLLTGLNTQVNFPTFGTNLTSNISVSSLTTLNDLTHFFNFASAKVVSEFRKYQENTPDAPLDEQLDTAALIDVQVTPDMFVSYKVAIYTRAGATYDFILPIPIATNNL